MSRWKDYGFPDPCGVWLQTALEGLLLAARERYRICRRNSHDQSEYRMEYFYADKPRLCGQVFYDIDIILNELSQWITSDGLAYTRFILPDGQDFSLENAAAFLGEELISLPRGTFSGRDWTNPFPALGYDWLMQRYRFINLIYMARLPDSALYGHEKITSGWGSSVSNAWTNAETAERSIHGWSHLKEEITSTEVYPNTENNYFYFKKYIFLPDKIIYPFYVSSRLTCNAAADKPHPAYLPEDWPEDRPEYTVIQGEKYYSRYTFDALGSSLQFKETTLLFDLDLEETIKMGNEISLSEVFSETFADAFEKTPVTAPPGNCEHNELIRGFYAQSEFLCDFRNYLNFYDPIFNTGEKQHA